MQCIDFTITIPTLPTFHIPSYPAEINGLKINAAGIGTSKKASVKCYYKTENGQILKPQSTTTFKVKLCDNIAENIISAIHIGDRQISPAEISFAKYLGDHRRLLFAQKISTPQISANKITFSIPIFDATDPIKVSLNHAAIATYLDAVFIIEDIHDGRQYPKQTIFAFQFAAADFAPKITTKIFQIPNLQQLHQRRFCELPLDVGDDGETHADFSVSSTTRCIAVTPYQDIPAKAKSMTIFAGGEQYDYPQAYAKFAANLPNLPAESFIIILPPSNISAKIIFGDVKKIFTMRLIIVEFE